MTEHTSNPRGVVSRALPCDDNNAHDALDAICRQRDELLAALEEIMTNAKIAATEGHLFADEVLRSPMARAAIAKAKGEA